MAVTSMFHIFFFEKIKEAPNPKVKILYSEGQINIYTVAKKLEQAILPPIISSMSNISHVKDNHAPNRTLSKFCWQ